MERQESLDVLGLSGMPTQAQIKAAHRAQSKRHHPDVGGSAEAMMRLNTAVDALLDDATVVSPSVAPGSSTVTTSAVSESAVSESTEVPALWSQLMFFAGVPIALVIVLVFAVMALSGIE